MDSSIAIYGRDTNSNINLRGYNIPKGTLLVLSQYHAHRNRLQWKNQEVFDPSRFLNETKESHHPCGKRHLRSYFPFGVGRRSCFGRFFSEAEVKIFLLSYLLQEEFSFALEDDSLPETEILCTSRLKHGLPVKVIANFNCEYTSPV